MSIPAWIENVEVLTAQINEMADKYDMVLEEWAAKRDEAAANNAAKENIDVAVQALQDAHAKLCALKGGKRSQGAKSTGRSQRKLKRTRKHRR
jgi:ElaB/YqjD/DUF883 family membrane-anchored ribosome-binding protein